MFSKSYQEWIPWERFSFREWQHWIRQCSCVYRCLFEIFRQSVGETESVLPTTASPASFWLGDFDARIWRKMNSLPELRNTLFEVCHEPSFHVLYFRSGIYFSLSLFWWLKCLFLMLLDPWLPRMDTCCYPRHGESHRRTNYEDPILIYLDGKTSTRWADQCIVHSIGREEIWIRLQAYRQWSRSDQIQNQKEVPKIYSFPITWSSQSENIERIQRYRQREPHQWLSSSYPISSCWRECSRGTSR